MICMNCGATLTDSVYCPVCGADATVQKQAAVLSCLFYNQGLEKAEIRDLSGAEDRLRLSLGFDKMNIQARNLLGLVYFERGEVVAALSEWVISSNLQPENNLASAYVENLRKDANRLDVINETIKKFNLALINARSNNEDVAMIQLRKILAQNPKLIKGYHLLALLYLKNEEYDRAKKLLRKALTIDRTNTTTLRYLRAVEQETGAAAQVPQRTFFRTKEKSAEEEQARQDAQPMLERLWRHRTAFFIIGFLLGAALVGLVFMPAGMRRVRRQAGEEIASYSAKAASQSAEISDLMEQIEQSRTTVELAQSQVEEAETRATSYEMLGTAVRLFNLGDFDGAASAMVEITPKVLSDEALSTYNAILYEVQTTLFRKLKNKGLTEMNHGDYKAAIAALERAKEIDDSDQEVLLTLTEAQTRLSEQQKAEREASGTAAIQPVIAAEEAVETPAPAEEEEDAAVSGDGTEEGALPEEGAAPGEMPEEEEPEDVEAPADRINGSSSGGG